MTELTHNPPNNPGGTTTENTSDSPEKNTPAKRKQRVRGCGVPPTVWFTPHPDNHPLDPATGRSAPDAGASGGTQEWAVAEIVRQFTTLGQHYSIIRIPAPNYLTNPIREGSVTRYRRTTEAGVPSGDCETSDRGGFELVAILAINRTDRAESTGVVIRDWSSIPGPAPSVEALIAGAKRMLADGGILALRLPRPTPGAGFKDGTGTAIDAVRRAGLAYLQHIALVDAYIDHEGITPALPQADLDAFWAARAQGVLVHARAHSDLLIFRKPAKDDTLA